jgi:hypothetical protein
MTGKRRQGKGRKERKTDQVTEAGLESFPASDPPAYNTPGRGKSDGSDPTDNPKDEDRPPREQRRN